MTKHEVVSEQEWMAARMGLLAKEKEATRHHDELARMRHQLPWVRVSKDYTFTGSDGKKTLADLFDGRSQLLIYHFMFHPDWEEGCPSLLHPGRSHRAVPSSSGGTGCHSCGGFPRAD